MAISLTSTGQNKLLDTGDTSFLYVAFGTGVPQTPGTGLTALTTELVRVAASSVVVSGNTITITAFLNTHQGNGNLSEFGVFDASSSGNMLLYGDMNGVSAATLVGSTYVLVKTATLGQVFNYTGTLSG